MVDAFRARGGSAAAAAAALLAACGQTRAPGQPLVPPPPPLASPVRVSGSSPYPAGCNRALLGAVNHPGTEVEPHLAVDPVDPRHLVGAWQQDRWQGGGANGIATGVSRDGGLTWAATGASFTFCSGALPGAGYDRASDPWVSFAPDGTVHQVALAFDDSWHGARQAVAVSRSADGGATWSDPVAVASETTADVALDKCTVTADPVRPGTVYAVWDRLAGLGGPLAQQTGPAFLARSVDGGTSWEPPRAIYDPGPDAQTISNQVAVLPDGTLVNLLVVILRASGATPGATVSVLRSLDAGTTWSDPPIDISPLDSVGTADPQTGRAVRDGSIVPQIAADPASGKLYVVWQDSRFSGGARDGIALSASADGGLTWSPPVQVNQDTGVQAFTPSVAVAASGRIAVAYYDFRFSDALPPGLWTVRWLASSGDGGATWDEVPAGGPFDLRLAPDAGGYFLGDYAGLVGLADSFVPFFSMSGFGGGDGADVFALPAPAGAMGLPPRAAAEQRVASPRSLRERLRDQREVERARTPNR